MKCKNCQDLLRTDFKYCPSCGAKIVERRLTFKGLFNDVVERVFNLENNVFKTIGHMTVWPERVIISYVEGTRRKYLNPLNYLTLSIALSGILFFFLKKFALGKMKFDVWGLNINTTTAEKTMNAVMEYSNFIFILYIPVLALSGWLSFNKRNHNMPEYLVTATYILAHVSIITFPLGLAVILGSPENYMKYSFISLALMLGYSLYALIRTHRYSIFMTLVRVVLFSMLFLMGYFAISIALNILLLLTGQLDLKDLVPPPPS